MIYTDGLVSLFAFRAIYAAVTFGWHTMQIGSFGVLLVIGGPCGRHAAGGGADAADTVGAARPHRAVFRTVRADRKGHLLRRAAADRRDHGGDGKPEGGDGGAGAVFRGGTGAAGAGAGLIPLVKPGNDGCRQCLKCLTPVNTMAMPASSAALMTSSSRTEPPGWITAVAPASTVTSNPSANGKKASDATTEPLVIGAASFNSSAASCALPAAMRAESTRLILPAPMPTVARSLAYTMVLDLTCLATRNANLRSRSSESVGARLVTTFSVMSSTTALSRLCTSKPPATVLAVRPALRGSGRLPASSRRKF